MCVWMCVCVVADVLGLRGSGIIYVGSLLGGLRRARRCQRRRPRARPRGTGGGGGPPDPRGPAPAPARAAADSNPPRGGPKVTNRRAIFDLAANSDFASNRVLGAPCGPVAGPAPSASVVGAALRTPGGRPLPPRRPPGTVGRPRGRQQQPAAAAAAAARWCPLRHSAGGAPTRRTRAQAWRPLA